MLLWLPNRKDAWVRTGLTVLYLLAFWPAVSLFSLGATRRWVLAALLPVFFLISGQRLRGFLAFAPVAAALVRPR